MENFSSQYVVGTLVISFVLTLLIGKGQNRMSRILFFNLFLVFLISTLSVWFVNTESPTYWSRVPLALLAVVWGAFAFRIASNEKSAVKKIKNGKGKFKYVLSHLSLTIILGIPVGGVLLGLAGLTDLLAIVEWVEGIEPERSNWYGRYVDHVTVNWTHLLVCFSIIATSTLVSALLGSVVAILRRSSIPDNVTPVVLNLRWRGFWSIWYRMSFSWLGARKFFSDRKAPDTNTCPMSWWIIFSLFTFLCGMIAWIIFFIVATIIFIFQVLFKNRMPRFHKFDEDLSFFELPRIKTENRNIPVVSSLLWLGIIGILAYNWAVPVSSFTYNGMAVPFVEGIGDFAENVGDNISKVGQVLLTIAAIAATIVLMALTATNLSNRNKFLGAIVYSIHNNLCLGVRFIGRPEDPPEPVVEKPVPFIVKLVTVTGALSKIPIFLEFPGIEDKEMEYAQTNEKGEAHFTLKDVDDSNISILVGGAKIAAPEGVTYKYAKGQTVEISVSMDAIAA